MVVHQKAEAIDPAVECIRFLYINKTYTGAYLPGCRVNKRLFTRQSDVQWAISPGSDKLAEVQVYMSTSCQPSSFLFVFC